VSVSAPSRAYNPPDGAEGTSTDIIFLVERLESLVANGKKLPLTNNVVLDQASVLELIDQLRASVPDEVRQARRITEDVGRITERATEESEAIIARAQEQAARLLEERELVRAAQQRAAQIIDTASNESAEVRRGADEYAAGVLIRLEGECIKALTSIKRGIDMLDERHRGGDGATGGSNVRTDPFAAEGAPEEAEAASRP
jgi:bifunctional DNA-binding transcriptional regulator/antitoxin component of YhaV-PrlF toxin-antitoxin module